MVDSKKLRDIEGFFWFKAGIQCLAGSVFVWIEVSKKKNHKSYSLHGGSILSTDPSDFEFHLFEASHGNSIAPGGKEQQFALKFLVEIVNYFPEISRKEQGKKRLE